MQRKTMMGLDLNYQFSPNLTLGATIMHMSEMPLTTKTAMGDEAIKNTLWGVNMAYKGESQWLTNMFDKLPLLNLSKPSQIAFNAEFAHLIAGHYENKNTGGATPTWTTSSRHRAASTSRTLTPGSCQVFLLTTLYR